MSSKLKEVCLSVRDDVVICAEGYVFELERRGYVKTGAYVPEVALDHPEVGKQLHHEFLRAGRDVVEALTYYAHRDKLKVIGREATWKSSTGRRLKLRKRQRRELTLLLPGICNTWLYIRD